MKRILLVLLTLTTFLILPANAQFGWIWGDADKFIWGASFKNTDSLKIVTALTEFSGSDTVYCNLILIPADNVVGTQNFAVSFDQIDITKSDSIRLDFRFYYNKNIHTDPWGDWYSLIGNIETDTLYVLQIADSSWWAPSSGYQLRSYRSDVSADTCSTPNISAYGN